MKSLSFFLILFFSFTPFAQSGELKARVLVLDKNHDIHYEMQWHEVLQLNSSVKRKVGPTYLSFFIEGLEAGLDGRLSYDYELVGTHRNPKVERQLGGLGSGSEDVRHDEAVSSYTPVSFEIKDVGIWDFKITLTDRVSGQKVVSELKGFEVTK